MIIFSREAIGMNKKLELLGFIFITSDVLTMEHILSGTTLYHIENIKSALKYLKRENWF